MFLVNQGLGCDFRASLIHATLIASVFSLYQDNIVNIYRYLVSYVIFLLDLILLAFKTEHCLS